MEQFDLRRPFCSEAVCPFCDRLLSDRRYHDSDCDPTSCIELSHNTRMAVRIWWLAEANDSPDWPQLKDRAIKLFEAQGGPAATPVAAAPAAVAPVTVTATPMFKAPTGSSPSGSGPSGRRPWASGPHVQGPTGSSPSGSGPSGSGPSGSGPSGRL